MRPPESAAAARAPDSVAFPNRRRVIRLFPIMADTSNLAL
jgi:hypothetical protein